MMISGDFKKYKSLKKFYDDIVELHNKEHGAHYCDVHNAIREALAPYGKRYVELGINQGATLACANITGLESSLAYDTHIERFNPQRHLFEDLGWRFMAQSGSSLDKKNVRECEVLYIDTVHNNLQLAKELAIWEKNVLETIIVHDTTRIRQLFHVLEKFCEFSKNWRIKTQNIESVGYTVLERIT